jgi:hypothetical protein
LSAGHFDSHGGAPVQDGAQHPMQHLQGYTGSHWTLPLGNYLLRIAPAAARVTGKQTIMNNKPTLLAFLMAMTVCKYITGHIAHWRRSRASLEAPQCRHWARVNYNNIKGTYHCRVFVAFFIVNTMKMGAKQKDGP